jgi:uncharacterized protein
MKNISTIMQYVQEKMSGEATGHDWFHVERVFQTATKIAKNEKDVDLFIIQSAALLHDLGDWKVKNSDKTEEAILYAACSELGVAKEDTEKILAIILNMSFSKNVGTKKRLSREGQIVQDADRLEALGAIGIARAFAYGGKKNRQIYDPAVKPRKFQSTEEYRTAEGHTINHFYEKLFKLRNLLNTKTAKQLALKREKFMKAFLKEFYSEWEGKA